MCRRRWEVHPRRAGRKRLAELSAQEIVRRADRGLGLAIRRGQEEGSLFSSGQHSAARNQWTGPKSAAGPDGPSCIPPKIVSFFKSTSERSATYDMTDGVSDEQFEGAIAEAKAEQDLSRVNVIRKVTGQASHRAPLSARSSASTSPRESGMDGIELLRPFQAAMK